jgi:hypothetical protein
LAITLGELIGECLTPTLDFCVMLADPLGEFVVELAMHFQRAGVGTGQNLFGLAANGIGYRAGFVSLVIGFLTSTLQQF